MQLIHHNMRQIHIFIAIILLAGATLSCNKGVKKVSYPERGLTVGFYNLENLFDTINDPDINDEEFLPGSKVRWNTEKYTKKLDNMSRVIAGMDPGSWPHLLGLAEIENETVLNELIGNELIKAAGYQVVHVAGQDPRGIEVAAIYRADYIKPINIKTLNPVIEGVTYRHILYIKGLIMNRDTIHFFVNHWTSRFGGLDETKAARNGTARFVKHVTDSLLSVNAMNQLILVGDFNDNPNDESMVKHLNAKPLMDDIEHPSLINLAFNSYKAGKGTLYYKGWDFFDQVIVSSSLIEGGKLLTSDIEIVKHDWMLFKPNQGEARPNRTMSGGRYFGGFSDHLPVLIRLRQAK